MKFLSHLSTWIKIRLKQIKDFNVRPETSRGKSSGYTSGCPGSTGHRIHNHQNEEAPGLERRVWIVMRQPAERGKKAFPTFYLAAYYYLKFSKNPKPKSEENKQSDWKFQWNWTEFSNEETEVTEKYLQSCSTSLAIGMQIKTVWDFIPPWS